MQNYVASTSRDQLGEHLTNQMVYRKYDFPVETYKEDKNGERTLVSTEAPA